MNNQDLDKVKKIAENHRVSPRPQAWDKLENMMNAAPKSTAPKKSFINYKFLSIAAIFLALVSVVSVFVLYNETHDPQVFASNEDYRPIVLEELPTGDDPFYNIENVASINEAYSKAGF